jgi:predicted kinase
MVDGRPTPFDALEFNDEMASTDLLYDIAFTVMDLQERGLHPQMTAFLSRYLATTRDYSGVSLLALFVSMRAAVRALVAASRDAPDPHEPDAGERLSHAIAVLDNAPRPVLVAVGGLSGSGKSTVARRIAPAMDERFGALLLRSDVARKTLFGVAPEDPLPADAYAPDVSRRLYRQLFRDAGRALRAGLSVVLDATFLSSSQKKVAAEIARAAGVGFRGLWLACSADELRRRILARRGDASDADLSVLDAQLASAPAPDYWRPVPADGTVQATTAHALAALGPLAGRDRAR